MLTLEAAAAAAAAAFDVSFFDGLGFSSRGTISIRKSNWSYFEMAK